MQPYCIFFRRTSPEPCFFGTRFQKGNFKRFPTKWYTFSLFESNEGGLVLTEGGFAIGEKEHAGPALAL